MNADHNKKTTGQALVEFALVLPLFLIIAFGAAEFGRILISFAELTNASREAARYGATTGPGSSGSVRYLDCAGIRDAARAKTVLTPLADSDIGISYDRDDLAGGMATFAECGDPGLDEASVIQGDRVVVSVTRTIEPILAILPIPSFPVLAVTARTIMKDVIIGPGECQDGVDNDGDGDTDFPGDSGCDNADDTIEAICYRLEVIANPAGAGVVSLVPATNCANRLIEGTVVTLNAIPDLKKDLYTFDKWIGDVSSTDNNPTTVTMDSNKSVTANFRRWEADLGISKNDSPDPVKVGETVNYSLTVLNNGPDPATGVVVTDTLPVEVNYSSAATTLGSCTESIGVVICDIGEIPVSGTVLIDIQVTVPSDLTIESITNTAVVAGSAREEDYDPGNNIDSESTTVQPIADIFVTKSANPSPSVYAEYPLTYTITAGNNGPSAATNVVITDTLPAGSTFVSASGPCTYIIDLSGLTGGTVSCAIGPLANSETAGVEIVIQAPSTAGDITNQAGVSASEHDDDTVNNLSPPVITQVLAWSDLSVTKVDSPDPVWRDQPLTYTITISNSGPSDATGIQILDKLPGEVSLKSAIGPLGACSEISGTVTCDVGNLPAGSTADAFIVVQPNSKGGLVNLTWYASTVVITDLIPINDTDIEITEVNVLADLQIVKSDLNDPVDVGDSLIYELAVTNNGPSKATDVKVVDTLPPSVFFTSASWPGGTCNVPIGHGFTCDLGDLNPENSVVITVIVIPTMVKEIKNFASVSADEPDPNESNDDDTAYTDISGVVGTPALSLSPDCGSPGGSINVSGSFFNYGPDTLEIHIIYENAGPSGIRLLSIPNYTTVDSDWSENVTLPDEPPAPFGEHQISAIHGGVLLFENLEVPCD